MIAVLIPCYNESKTIGKVVEDFRRVLPEAAIYVYEQSGNLCPRNQKNCIWDGVLVERNSEN